MQAGVAPALSHQSLPEIMPVKGGLRGVASSTTAGTLLQPVLRPWPTDIGPLLCCNDEGH